MINIDHIIAILLPLVLLVNAYNLFFCAWVSRIVLLKINIIVLLIIITTGILLYSSDSDEYYLFTWIAICTGEMLINIFYLSKKIEKKPLLATLNWAERLYWKSYFIIGIVLIILPHIPIFSGFVYRNLPYGLIKTSIVLYSLLGVTEMVANNWTICTIVRLIRK
jgi:hypothetical protein